MTEKEFNLSNLEQEGYKCDNFYWTEDVREAVRLLKEALSWDKVLNPYNGNVEGAINAVINKIFGEKLSK